MKNPVLGEKNERNQKCQCSWKIYFSLVVPTQDHLLVMMENGGWNCHPQCHLQYFSTILELNWVHFFPYWVLSMIITVYRILPITFLKLFDLFRTRYHPQQSWHYIKLIIHWTPIHPRFRSEGQRCLQAVLTPQNPNQIDQSSLYNKKKLGFDGIWWRKLMEEPNEGRDKTSEQMKRGNPREKKEKYLFYASIFRQRWICRAKNPHLWEPHYQTTQKLFAYRCDNINPKWLCRIRKLIPCIGPIWKP